MFSKTTLKSILSLKKWILTFNPKIFGVKENRYKTMLNFCLLKCAYLGKNSFQLNQLLARNNEFKE